MSISYVLLWAVWLLVVALGILAVRANQVEREEGLEVSRLRLLTLGIVVAVATVLVFALTLAPGEAVAGAPASAGLNAADVPDADKARAAQLNEHLTSVTQQIQAVDAQQVPVQKMRGELTAERDRTQRSLESLRGGAHPFEVVKRSLTAVDARRRTDLGLLLLMFLLAVGVGGLVVGGKLQALFPNGLALAGIGSIKDEELRERLDELASLMAAERYQDAIERAATIPEKRLRPLDLLDLLYLRGLANIHLMATPAADMSEQTRTAMVDAAIADLEYVTEEAPKRDEALFALGVAYGYRSRHQEALAAFDLAAPMLDGKLSKPLDVNRGVCCLRLAEQSLREGKTQQAEGYFERAASLGEKGDSVVQSRMRIAMLGLRSALAGKDVEASAAALAKIEALPNLPVEQKAQVQVISSALKARLALRRDDPAAALTECNAFLEAYLPADLPQVSDETADQTFSPLEDADLRFPVAIYQNFVFLRAVALVKLQGRQRGRPTQAEVDTLAGALLLGLLFVPRQRDLLGALGGLYAWFRREQLARALAWLEAAVRMGAKGRLIRTILEQDRLLEQQRGTALDWFRTASTRFLRDPALSGEVRHALVEELGRFQEFRPMLMSLEERPQLAAEEPTLEGLRSRTRYLAELIQNVAATTGSADRVMRLSQLHADFSSCLQTLETGSLTIATLERQAFTELADTLSMR